MSDLEPPLEKSGYGPAIHNFFQSKVPGACVLHTLCVCVCVCVRAIVGVCAFVGVCIYVFAFVDVSKC